MRSCPCHISCPPFTSCTHRSSALSHPMSASCCPATANTPSFHYLLSIFLGCWDARGEGQIAETTGTIRQVGATSLADQRAEDGQGCKSGWPAGQKLSLFQGRRWLQAKKKVKRERNNKCNTAMTMKSCTFWSCHFLLHLLSESLASVATVWQKFANYF